MTFRRGLVVASGFAAALLAAPALSAQQAGAPLEEGVVLERTRTVLDSLVGHRVRIRTVAANRNRFAGLLDSVHATAIVVDTITDRPTNPIFGSNPPVLERYRRITLPLAEIQAVEASRGLSRTRGVLWGALLGSALVATIEGLSGVQTRSPADGTSDYGSNVLRGAVIGVALGAPAGYFFGRERWTRVDIGGG